MSQTAPTLWAARMSAPMPNSELIAGISTPLRNPTACPMVDCTDKEHQDSMSKQRPKLFASSDGTSAESIVFLHGLRLQSRNILGQTA
jgi:hypothetical protein